MVGEVVDEGLVGRGPMYPEHEEVASYIHAVHRFPLCYLNSLLIFVAGLSTLGDKTSYGTPLMYEAVFLVLFPNVGLKTRWLLLSRGLKYAETGSTQASTPARSGLP